MEQSVKYLFKEFVNFITSDFFFVKRDAIDLFFWEIVES